MYAPNYGQQGQQAQQGQGQAAQKTPSRAQSRPLPDLGADPHRANSTFSPSPLASQPIQPHNGVHAPIARPYQSSFIGHGIPPANPTPHPLARSVSCAPSPASVQSRNNVMRHHPYTQDARPQTAHRSSTPGPRTPGPRASTLRSTTISTPVQHNAMTPTPLDPRLSFQPGLAHMHGQVMSPQYYPPVNALPPTPTSAGPALCHPQQSWSWSVPNNQNATPNPLQTPVSATYTPNLGQQQQPIGHQYQQPPTPSTPWLINASLPSSAGSPYTNQAQLRAATPGPVEPKPSSAINIHLACETRYASLQAMCRSLDDAVNHISQAHAQLQSEGNSDMIAATNQLIHENEELRSRVTAQTQNQTQIDPRLQQGANDPGDQQGTTNPTQKSLDALEKTNMELEMANTELGGQLLAESQISQSLRSKNSKLEETNSRHVVAAQSSRTSLKKYEEVLEQTKTQLQIKTNQSLAFQFKLVNQKRFIEAAEAKEQETKKIQCDHEKVVSECGKLRSENEELQKQIDKRPLEAEQAGDVVAEEVVPSAPLATDLDHSQIAAPSTELIAIVRSEVAGTDVEKLKLQTRVMELEAELKDRQMPWLKDGESGDKTRFEQLLSVYEIEKMEKEKIRHELQMANERVTRQELIIGNRNNRREITKLQAGRLEVAQITDLTTTPTTDEDAMDINESPASETGTLVENQTSQLIAQPSLNIKQADDRSLSNLKDDRGLQAMAHVGRICFGAMDLMEWIDGVLDQYCASRPLAERRDHVGRSKLKVLMSEIKASVDCLLAPGPGSKVGRGEESQEGKAESSSSA